MGEDEDRKKVVRKGKKERKVEGEKKRRKKEKESGPV
jgi:hypothetical protein